MTQIQYKRKVKLLISTESGEGLDLSNLRIAFDIKLTDSQTPNSARIRVYNLSQNLASRVQKEFTYITLQAGYESNFGTIFYGNIKQVIYGSENNVDTFIDIAAGDGDDAYNYSVVNRTLDGNVKQSDIVDAALLPMFDRGIEQGFVDSTGDTALPRGRVMYGMSRDYLQAAAYNTDTTWSIQNGKYQSVKLTGYVPNTAVVLNSKTGLVGTPNQTNDGIIVKCLLNPNIKIASQVQINQADIQLQLIDDSSESGDSGASSTPSPIASDGFYRVLIAEYTGDTRGNDWYCDLTCLSMDKTSADNSQVQKNG